MKILVIGEFPSSATSKPMAELFIGLHQKGIGVEIMCADKGRIVDLMKSAGVTIIDHHPGKKVDLNSTKFIRNHLEEHQPQILYLLNSKSIANGIRAVKSIDIKVITYRGAAGLYWHDPTSYLTHLNRRVDKVICNSKYVESNVKSQMPYMRKKTQVIYPGFDPSWYKIDQGRIITEFGIPEGATVVGCIANNRPVKGVKYLIRSMNYLKDAKNVYFLLIGTGIKEEFEKERSNCSFPDQIICTDHIEDINAMYNCFDIYVQPSLKEGFGKSIVEAMCNAKPVIATSSGGPEEIIVDGKSGLLVKKGSAKAIAEKIDVLIEDKIKRREIGEAGFKRITKDFSIEETVNKYFVFFNEIIDA